jgi:hypothetical protein
MEEIITQLLTELGKELLEADLCFIEEADRFDKFERTVLTACTRTAAQFLSEALTDLDATLRKCADRERYTIQRQRERTLISTAGTLCYKFTVFKDKKKGVYRTPLHEIIRLPDRERFSTEAEALVLKSATEESYSKTAGRLKIGDQEITKTTVMDIVHGIPAVIPDDEEAEEKKELEYLYIEADEDHIAVQKDPEQQGCFIGKLIYLYESKEDILKGKRKLVGTQYFGGLHRGSEANTRLWEGVQNYIENHYDTDVLKKVYISSDGGGWIAAGARYIYKGVTVADKYHVMKYINSVANLTLDEREITKGRFYKYIWKNKLLAAKKLLTRIENHCGGEETVERTRIYLVNNWSAIVRAYRDRHVYGCSAEGHVSSVYSDRMSSRPMAWSETGSDRMCKLRVFTRNGGNIVELVRYRRELVMSELESTGTEDAIAIPRYTAEERRNRSYIARIQAKMPGFTVHKILTIREQEYI